MRCDLFIYFYKNYATILTMVLWHPFRTSIHLNFSSTRRKGNEDGTDLNKPIEGQPRYKTKGIILKLNFKV